MRTMDDLPGGALVAQGLRDLGAGTESLEALLVAIGSPRLGELGFVVEHPWPNPEHRLYAHIVEQVGDDSAHSRFNALIRELVSFERAASCAA